MNEFEQRLAGLSPERRALLKRRMAAGKLEKKPRVAVAGEPAVSRGMDFSLYFFSADGSGQSRHKYQLLLDAVRFGDQHRFHAVWTPERHFQDFGGLFPNPSVLAAGLATMTQHIQLRAGSVVIPLHSPVRIAEEWAVVDNLSGGRVGISTATGWHAHDYVIRPHAFEQRRELMFEGIPLIRRLWAGESVPLPGPDGQPVPVRSLPRPIQDHLPIWVTATSPGTWKRAAALGCHVFTAFIGHGVDQLATMIRDYRADLAAAGHDPRKGKVTLMVHAHIGDDLEAVKARVREPMKRYLVHFFEQMRPLLDQDALATHQDNQDQLLEFAFERYFQSASLLGTVDKCRPLVASLADAGVSELACLVDFGLPEQQVLDGLEGLNQLRALFNQAKGSEPSPHHREAVQEPL